MKRKHPIKIIKNKYSIYFLFGLILWLTTIILRDINISVNHYFNLFLGILPNFAVVFFAFGIGMTYLQLLIKKPFKYWHSYLVLGLIWILLLLSEYIHQIFLGSPWDNLDILASLLASITILILDHKYSIKQKIM